MTARHVVLVTTSPAVHPATIALATDLAAGLGAALLFLHVVPLRPEDGVAMLHDAAAGFNDGADAWLRALRPTSERVPFRHERRVGVPEDIVEDVVARLGAALVVVEEPPRAWWSRVIERSFAEALIPRVSCPVVVGGPRFLEAATTPEPVPAAAPAEG